VCGARSPRELSRTGEGVPKPDFLARPCAQDAPETILMTEPDGKNSFRLTLTGAFGVAYQILGSTNLADWASAGTVTNTWGTVPFMDGAGTNLPQRFYRAVQAAR
jgi:hypothetical protein